MEQGPCHKAGIWQDLPLPPQNDLNASRLPNGQKPSPMLCGGQLSPWLCRGVDCLKLPTMKDSSDGAPGLLLGAACTQRGAVLAQRDEHPSSLRKAGGVQGLLGTSRSSLGLKIHCLLYRSPSYCCPYPGFLGDSTHQSVGVSLFQLCLLTAFLP